MESRKLQNILLVAKQNNASDVHLTPNRKPFIRVASQLSPIDKEPKLKPEDTFSFAKELLSEKQLSRVSDLEEVDFSFSYDDMRIRGTAFIQGGAVGIILRVIPKIKTIEELNLPEALKQFAKKEQGLFLVVGPVGQGKTTTLASIIDLINTERKEHIVTIEDPVEYLFKDKNSVIDQREVGIDTKSFATGLKSVFRQDVNVIMIGEMRDHETMAAAVSAAETGHLVLSTLHTNNAAQSINRIIDSFPPEQQNQVRTQLSTSLLGVFSQRLIVNKSGQLIPAYELMINNKATANLIREKRTFEIDSVIQTSAENGMVDMNRTLLELVNSGQIDIEDAYKYALDPDLLESMI